MKSRIVIASAALSMLLTTPLHADNSVFYDHAKVLDARPVYETVSVSTPRTVCRDVQVSSHAAPRSYTGVVAGGIIGGAIGNQIVHGKYRDWGTVAGALLGGSLGNDYTNRHQPQTFGSHTVERCHQVERVSEQRRLAGYDVTYRYQGRDHVAFMDHDPGKRVRVAVSVDVAE